MLVKPGRATVAALRAARAGRSLSSTANFPTSMTDTLRLRDGTRHPVLGYGTYKVGVVPASASANSAPAPSPSPASSTSPSSSSSSSSSPSTSPNPKTVAIFRDALKCGYRMIDCAQFYENEKEVGVAIEESGISRDKLFLCSKVFNHTIYKGPDAVKRQVEQTLRDLRTSRLDLYLVHWPVPGYHVAAYLALQDLQRQGLLKSIGVSNYMIEDYKQLQAHPGVHSLPVVNQIEASAFAYRRQTIRSFQEQQVVIQAYRPLDQAKTGALKNPTVLAIARTHHKTPSQVLIRWCLQRGFVCLTKTVSLPRMQENAAVFDFSLTSEEMGTLDALTTQERLQEYGPQYRKCVVRDTPLPLDNTRSITLE
eukprot:g28522.t1